MVNEMNQSACKLFAGLFAQTMARSVSAACGAEWRIELTDPPPVDLPVIAEPLHCQLRFSRGLRGGCCLVMSLGDVSGFGSDKAAVSQKEAASALLALLQEVISSLPGALAEAHGEVLIEAAMVEALEADPAHAIALSASGAAGKTAVLLLHFDSTLVAAFAGQVLAGDQFFEDHQAAAKANLELVMDVELNCTLRFGQRQLSLREILDLASGSVVELDRQVDEPVELILDGKVIARGEAVIIDGNYGLRVTQVVQPVLY